MPPLLPPPLLMDSMDSMMDTSLVALDIALEAEDFGR
jgi:hypothetical protein